ESNRSTSRAARARGRPCATPRSSRPFMPTDYVAVKPACLTLLICGLTLRCLNGERTEQSMSDMARPSAEEFLDDEQFSLCPSSTGLWRDLPSCANRHHL